MNLFESWLVETPIAHRGYHGKSAPENSMLAFSKAIEKGYAIELDVQLLSDGTVVVFHDDSLARMTGNDGYIKYLTKTDLKAPKTGRMSKSAHVSKTADPSQTQISTEAMKSREV